jgi:alcohol dehydrogenase class IV
MALGGSMLALGHAIAQALGGRYGLSHGAMNALALPLALRFNEEVAPEAVRRFGEALGADDPAARVQELARLAASSGCATSGSLRRISPRWQPRRSSARAPRRTHGRRPRARSRSSYARSTE